MTVPELSRWPSGITIVQQTPPVTGPEAADPVGGRS